MIDHFVLNFDFIEKSIDFEFKNVIIFLGNSK